MHSDPHFGGVSKMDAALSFPKGMLAYLMARPPGVRWRCGSTQVADAFDAHQIWT